jgi:hypothetical protein
VSLKKNNHHKKNNSVLVIESNRNNCTPLFSSENFIYSTLKLYKTSKIFLYKKINIFKKAVNIFLLKKINKHGNQKKNCVDISETILKSKSEKYFSNYL